MLHYGAMEILKRFKGHGRSESEKEFQEMVGVWPNDPAARETALRDLLLKSEEIDFLTSNAPGADDAIKFLLGKEAKLARLADKFGFLVPQDTTGQS